MSVFFIAEAGVNHNGSREIAERLVDVAAFSGADAVKFQTFKAEKMISVRAEKAAYQIQTTGTTETQLEMVRRLELDRETHHALFDRCLEKGIEFLSTPFDEESVDFLAKDIKVSRLKIPSGEITNGPLLLHIARKGLPVILSTGMSTLGEVEDALSVLAYGFSGSNEPPSRESFRRAYSDAKSFETLYERVILLHCTTEYPAPYEAINLRAMDTLRDAFGLRVGYSDHTPGIEIALAAAARGACIVEKHFTLSRSMEGPDHSASLEPEELGALVSGIRKIENALGSLRKIRTPHEEGNARCARKSLVASRIIHTGETFTCENVTSKRPGDGLSPMSFWDVSGTKARRIFPKDSPILP